jgi:DnaJ-class molecular chaperone
VTAHGHVRCPQCEGTGVVCNLPYFIATCPTCYGHGGWVLTLDVAGGVQVQVQLAPQLAPQGGDVDS